MKKPIQPGIFIICLLFLNNFCYSQVINKVIVEIKTGDKRFAGTDDPIHFLIGGKDFNLDNPSKNDFERNQTDVFSFDISDINYTVELIRAIGTISINKTEDSYFGGGWYFGTIKIWLNNPDGDPIFQNDAINKWLDGDNRSWSTNLGDPGWNLPESPPFPPCQSDDIIILLAKESASNNSKPDSDCDGIPDDIDPTFDPNQPDNDGDGLPNLFEEQNGLDPNNPDSDGDGWLDGNNLKDLLILTKLQCLDEAGSIEIGSDEIYLNIEDIRFPTSISLDNYWEMDDGATMEPFIIVDQRTVSTLNTAPKFITRVNFRESDFTFMEKPTDDTFQSFMLNWTRNQTMELEVTSNDSHYKLFFKSVTLKFSDLDPDNSDMDADDIPDALEFLISTQNTDLRPVGIDPVLGYDGLSDPTTKNLFIEVDATSSDDDMPFDAKQQVVSQFWNQQIDMSIDDGYLDGGEVLPYDEEVLFSELATYKNNNLWDGRANHYRYALYVPDMGGGNGRAARPGTRFMVSRSSMIGSFSSIVFIHELGHTLDLCHPIGTQEPPSPSPICPTPANFNGCTHYCGVDDESITAMGDDIGFENIFIGGAIGVMVGLAIIALFIPGIGWLAGAALLLGAALIGSISGFFFSDSYLRIVDYHPNEWAALLFQVF